MTGAQSFPDGTGGAVHFCWPDEYGYQSWQYLGSISNDKPSAVFKIRSLKNSASTIEKSMFASSTIPHTSAKIGISMETMDELINMCPAAQAEVAKSIGSLTVVERLTTRVAEHLVNYMASFARSQDVDEFLLNDENNDTKYVKRISLDGIEINAKPKSGAGGGGGDAKHRYCFTLTPLNGRVFTFSCVDETDYDTWLDACFTRKLEIAEYTRCGSGKDSGACNVQ